MASYGKCSVLQSGRGRRSKRLIIRGFEMKKRAAEGKKQQGKAPLESQGEQYFLKN